MPKLRSPQLHGQPPEQPPVVGHRAAALGNRQAQRLKILEKARQDELHESGGVEVVRSCTVKVRVAGAAQMDYARDVEFDHLLEERISVTGVQRRVFPIAVDRVRVHVAAANPVFADAQEAPGVGPGTVLGEVKDDRVDVVPDCGAVARVLMTYFHRKNR